MTTLKQNLDNLLKLVDNCFVKQFGDLFVYSHRVFLSTTEWKYPNALDCRGIVLDANGNVVCRPVEKFFNWGENEFTLNLNADDIDEIYLKEDGSLMSAFWWDNSLRLKTKNDLNIESPFIKLAQKFLEDHSDFSNFLESVCKMGNTVNMELCVGEDDRIILSESSDPDFESRPYDIGQTVKYSKTKLVILNIRKNETGEYLDLAKYKESLCNENYWVQTYKGLNLDMLRNVKDIEGFVVRLKPSKNFPYGQLVKIKTEWYLMERKLQADSLNNLEILQLIKDEKIDDIKPRADQSALTKIAIVEEKFKKQWKHLTEAAKEFYNKNKTLTRKDYAQAALKCLDKGQMQVAMVLYIGREDWQEIVKGLIRI